MSIDNDDVSPGHAVPDLADPGALQRDDVELLDPRPQPPEWVTTQDPDLLDWLSSTPVDPADDPHWIEPDLPPCPDDGPEAPAEPDTGPGSQVGSQGRLSLGRLSLALLSDLARQDPGGVSSLGLIMQVRTWQRFTGFSTTRIWVHLAELHARFTGPAHTRLEAAHTAGEHDTAKTAADDIDLAERSLTAEIAAALTWSGTRARDQLDIALTLTRHLVDTLDAVTRGDLEVTKAEAIARALRREHPDLARAVETVVLPHAAAWTVPHLHEQIRATLLRLAPELAAHRAQTARKARRVTFRAEPDDMLKLEAILPLEDGILIQAALDHTAHTLKTHQTHQTHQNQQNTTGAGADPAADQPPHDQRTLDQIRCDVLTDTLLSLADDPTPPAETAAAETAATRAEPAAHAQGTHPTSAAGGTSTGSTSTGSTSTAGGTDTAGSGSGSTSTAGGTGTAGGTAGGAAGSTAGSSGTGGSDRDNTSCSNTSCSNTGRARTRRTKRNLRSEVVLTVPLETITGDAEHPGYLSRYGPISAHTARRMAWQVATDGYWRCAVTDDTHGTLLGLGRSTFTPAYQAPEHLQRFVNLRDRTCDFPGCRIPATACDFEHTIPYPKGSTCECGGVNRCGNHHRLKHETSWNVRRSQDPQHPPGTHVWTSPTGLEYISSPPTIGVPAATQDPTGDKNRGPRTSDPGPAETQREAATESDTARERHPAQESDAARKPGQPVRDDWAYDPNLPELPTAAKGKKPESRGGGDHDEGEPPPF